jgi:hypothetical protein
MISKPSSSQVLRAIAAQLSARVLPAVSDPVVCVELQMMIGVVGGLAVRAEHEIAWMVAETERVATLAAGLDDELRADPEVVAALADLGAAPSGLDLESVQQRYDIGSRLLCRISDLAHAGGVGATLAGVRAQYDERIAHELRIAGVFQAVGRE